LKQPGVQAIVRRLPQLEKRRALGGLAHVEPRARRQRAIEMVAAPGKQQTPKRNRRAVVSGSASSAFSVAPKIGA
jgi:hypothetical protein